MSLQNAFAADSSRERRDDAVLSLIAAGLKPSEIAALTVGDVRMFPTTATVRVVRNNRECFFRLRSFCGVVNLRYYLERDAAARASSPLFPGRWPMRGMSLRRIYQLLDELREPNAHTTQESA